MEDTKQTLIIVESPTKAKTITKFLPKNYKVIASKGHIRDLSEKDMSIDIDHGYECKYQIVKGKGPIIKQLKDELKKSDNLLLATDEDREGESISWHLLQELKPKVPYKRMVFHEITRSAITKALSGGRDLDENMVQAQEGRRVVDRLYGYTLSPTLWAKLANKKLSAGRVQSVGLRLTVERERERIAFSRHSYFDAEASLLSQNGDAYQAKLVAYQGKNLAQSKNFDNITGVYKGNKDVLLVDQDKILEIVSSLKNKDYLVSDIQIKPFATHPNIPFTTSTLQQDAIKKLHLSASLVMSVAQTLYENGFITYMRTDSPSLSSEGTNAARESVEQLYGKDYLSGVPRYFTAHTAGAQEAHEAIRPSGEHFRKPEETGLSGRELQLYELIWKRTLACQMADAQKSTTTATITAGEGTFVASGTQILFPGFIRAYVEGSEDPEAALFEKETLLPPLSKGEKEILKDLSSVEHQTKAPARYTEASLVQELEKRGIGRPSTYATIIKTLLDRSYVIRENGTLVPTFIGFAVCQYLEHCFAQFVDYDFTSNMESGLDQIAEGKMKKIDFLDTFYQGSKGLLQQNTEQLALMDKALARSIHLSQVSDDNPIMMGPYGCYVQKKKEGTEKPEYITIPETWLPGTVTDEMVKELLAQDKQGSKAQSIELSEGVQLKNGKFGPYWQCGDKKASVPKWAQAEHSNDVVLAKRYLSLPRMLGKDSTGNEVYATVGKFGPYVGCDGNYRNLSKVDNDEQLFSITLQEALGLLAQEKVPSYRKRGGGGKVNASSDVLFTYGDFEDQKINLVSGRYGFYVKHGKDNYALPVKCKKDEALAKGLSLTEVLDIIRDKREKDSK